MFAASLGMSAGDVASGSYALPSTIQDIEATERLCRSARTELAEIANLLAEENLSAIESHVVVTSRPSSAILDYATATNVDKIATSTNSRGLSRWRLGSVSDAVLRASRLPLLLSRPVTSGVRAPAHSPITLREELRVRQRH